MPNLFNTHPFHYQRSQSGYLIEHTTISTPPGAVQYIIAHPYTEFTVLKLVTQSTGVLCRSHYDVTIPKTLKKLQFKDVNVI